jgi:putative transposase
VPTEEGWLYVAAIKDLFAGEIVGRSFGQRMTTELVVRACGQAVSARRPAPGLIHHSDRGSQYCSHEYRGLLASHGMRASMSRKGNCYDNAPIESFWGTLKTELVHHRRYQSRSEAAREIAEYIDLFYNRQRWQARLGYLSPAAYTQQFMRQQQAAWTSYMTSTFDDPPHAACVPSSKVTFTCPRSSLRKSRMVAAPVSMTDSITSLPSAFKTAMQMLALCTSSPT